MKYIAMLLCLLAFSVNADPRIETNNGFCHFQFDTKNAANELFKANTQSNISVKSGVATGYCAAKATIPESYLESPDGKRQYWITNNDLAVPCNMVESNGTVYTASKWKQHVRVRFYKPHGLVAVRFKLTCFDGRA